MPALKDQQAAAAAPDVHAWVAASAGTGKTQVLSARVLRLLLQGTPPHAILCLTFTKLAAAEMKTRIFDRLAHWTRCDEAELAHDLASLRAGNDAEMIGRARRLFATVLDAPQGLAIETIHAFAQGLIASFPIEAGVTPGFKTLDDREGTALRRRLLGDAIDRADEEGDDDFLADLAAISIAGGEARLPAVIGRLAGHDAALATLRREAVTPMLRRGLRMADGGNAETALATAMARFDADSVAHLADAFMAYGAPTAKAAAEGVRFWLGADDRAAHFERLRCFFLTGKHEPRSPKAVPAAAEKAQPGLCALFSELAAAVVDILAELRLEKAVALAAAHLRIGIVVAADWRAAKARLGVIDYDDMIAAALRLLDGQGAVDWVRYKLDQRIDHVLVDEAQDTNEEQWDIVDRLVAEFFAGVGARDVQRTLFVVGDFKQAIFGFQGSDPKVYADRKEHFAGLATDSRELWRDIPLATNFRSVPAVLDVVDAVADLLGHEALDRSGLVPRHEPARVGKAGAVTLWPPVEPQTAEGEDEAEDDSEEPEDSDDNPVQVTRADIALAHQVADQIARWLNPHAPLRLPSNGKPVRPQDILVLVRSRSAFSTALVGALHQAEVPVAGVDRLKLSDPLAVADLLALVRFALQPGDDLTLACLLVSPFLDIGHDRLYTLAAGRRGSLWEAVRVTADATVMAARDWLLELLGFADFAGPYAFLERVLSGPLQGRRRLLERLGEEARDAIDAVLDQALAFEALQAPSLQGFLAFVEDDSIEIKRDPDAPLAAVRLMTVHGAKGLQAPVVILADATKARRPEREAPVMMSFDNGPELPLFLPGRSGFGGRLGNAIEAAEQDSEREHCRLLYVALTRAEDMLFIGGAVKNADKVPEGSWYSTVEAAMTELGAVDIDVPGMGTALHYATGTPADAQEHEQRITPDDAKHPPGWLVTPAPQEARPPRPLSPSAIAADGVAAPPPSPEMRAAARRGTALHALFERLPEVAPERRRSVGEAFVAGAFPEQDATALVATALGVLDDPQFAAVFAPGALAEAPVAAVVGEIVVTGTVDRLLVSDSEVLVVDFKTGRRVPADADGIDAYYLRQMGAYVAALQRVFPGKPVRAALLYTEGPKLLPIPDDLIALHAPKAELSLNGGRDAPILPA
jgi:ATP-dependent helicase/nuclease subunit A